MTAQASAAKTYANTVQSSVVNTFAPSSLVVPSVISYPDLSRGVIHQQHLLTVKVSITITNNTGAAIAAGGLSITKNPRGVLAYLTNLLYKSNSQNTLWAMPGYEAFVIAMMQAEIDFSAAQVQGSGKYGPDPTTYLLTDFSQYDIQNTAFAVGQAVTFNAVFRLPVNWYGTQTAPQLLGYSTVSPAVTSFQMQMSTGTVSDIMVVNTANVAAAITAASIELEETVYPYNGDPASLPYFYPQLILSGDLTVAGAAQNQQIKLAYGAGEIYKRFFLFTRDTSVPYAKGSDAILNQLSLIGNTNLYYMNGRTADSLKAEYALRYNRSIPVGAYVHDRLLHGNLLDVLNSAGLSSLNLVANLAAAGLLTVYSEKLMPNVPLPTPPAHKGGTAG